MSDSTLDFTLPRIIHPLDDLPEEKLYRAELGRMTLTRTVRLSLFTLRLYLGLMVLLVAWRVIGG
jgi:hypothetical protein